MFGSDRRTIFGAGTGWSTDTLATWTWASSTLMAMLPSVMAFAVWSSCLARKRSLSLAVTVVPVPPANTSSSSLWSCWES